MTAEPIATPLLDLDEPKGYVVRIERAGKVWNVSVPMALGEAQAWLLGIETRRAARLKTSNDAWERVPQRHFICRIQYEEIEA